MTPEQVKLMKHPTYNVKRPDGKYTDEKNRVHPSMMDEREMLEEILVSQRETQDLVVQFIEGLKTNPMMRMMAGKMGL